MNSVFDWPDIFLLLTAIAFLFVVRLFISSRIHTRHSSNSTDQTNNWHADKITDVFTTLKSTDNGLTDTEAKNRLTLNGPNQLPTKTSRGPIKRFLSQFHNLLIYVLISASVVTALLEHWVDSGVILAVVFLNAMIGFIQEGKAEDALNAIKDMLSLNAMVLRNGIQLTIPATSLVMGDIVLLQSGDKIPADLRLFRSKGLQIQEAALTGESIAVDKITDPVDIQSVLGDRHCMAFSSTIVSHGQGAGIVVATGTQTEIGRISTLVTEVESVTTPLITQMNQFGRRLTFVILIIAAITFCFGLFVRDYAITDMFLAAVSLAVAAIPEGLPAIMTITLAIGVQRMAKRNAIIRKLPAVETLGAVNIICSDKTGTLTCNQMTVRNITTADTQFSFSGTGYDPHGTVSVDGHNIIAEDWPLLEQISRAALLCNDSSLQQTNNDWQVHGDPMEGALLVSSLKAGLSFDTESKLYPRTDLIPFESEHRFMATLHHSHTRDAFIFIKGSPELVLEKCAQQRMLDKDQTLDKTYWLTQIENMACQGQRVLAIAIKPVSSDQIELNFHDVENDLIMLGLFGLIDPPREQAVDALRVCHDAGIRVKMITGDHGSTARAIAQQLNLINSQDVLTGIDLENMDDTQLLQRILDVDIYARVNPEHKLRLVKLLQQQGLVVAMTGDGVNDAPALKRADVGTAMGHNGTEAAKEAAEMVLADNNFASITHAIEEGRTVYDNLKKAIIFILPTNGGEALIILVAIVFGFQQLPLTPVQILWVNMITAVTLALSLAFEPPEQNVMQRSPRNSHAPMLSSLLIWRIVFVSIILMTGTFSLFIWEIQHNASIELARTVAVNTLVTFEIFYLFNSRYITASIFSRAGLTGNRYVLIAIFILILFQLAFTYLPIMQSLFHTLALDYITWLRIIIVSSSVLFLVELEKYFIRHFESNHAIHK